MTCLNCTATAADLSQNIKDQAGPMHWPCSVRTTLDTLPRLAKALALMASDGGAYDPKPGVNFLAYIDIRGIHAASHVKLPKINSDMIVPRRCKPVTAQHNRLLIVCALLCWGDAMPPALSRLFCMLASIIISSKKVLY